MTIPTCDAQFSFSWAEPQEPLRPKPPSRREGGPRWTAKVNLLLRADVRGWIGSDGCQMSKIGQGFEANGINSDRVELLQLLRSAGFELRLQLNDHPSAPHQLPTGIAEWIVRLPARAASA